MPARPVDRWPLALPFLDLTAAFVTREERVGERDALAGHRAGSSGANMSLVTQRIPATAPTPAAATSPTTTSATSTGPDDTAPATGCAASRSAAPCDAPVGAPVRPRRAALAATAPRPGTRGL